MQLQERARSAARWGPALGMAVLLGLLVLVQVQVEARLRGTPGAAVFELLRPAGQLSEEQSRQMYAPRGRMLRILEALADPANPLGLRPEEQGAAAVHLRRLSEHLDELLRLQNEVVREVSAEDVRRHLAFMRDPEAHRLLQEPWGALNAEVARVYPGGAWPQPQPQSAVTGPLQVDPLWREALGDMSADIGGDPFLERRLVQLVTVRMRRHRQGPDASTGRLLEATRQAAALPNQCFQDWAVLFQLAVTADPNVLQDGGIVVHVAFEDFTDRLRRAADSASR